jgi:L-alanine-DL-glutamate epimerase-like enolase superfamily enzyme
VKITNVTPLPIAYEAALVPMTFFVVRVETDSGLIGYGESCDCFGISYPGVLAAVVDQAFAPHLVGKTLESVEGLLDDMRLATRRELGEQWASAQARSAVEMALWDLVGQAAGRSVSSLFGRVRDRIPVYAGSSPFLDDHPVDYHLERLAPLLERGVRSVKMRIGPNPKQAVATLAELRGKLPDCELMVDASEWLDMPTSLWAADALADLGIAWLEEPFLQKRHTAIARLTRKTRVPIAYGEHLYSLEDGLDVLAGGEVDVIQPDPCICGFTDSYRLSRIAAHYGARVALHYHAGPVGLAACLQLAGSARTADVLEFPFHLLPVLAGLSGDYSGSLDLIVDGHIAIPDRPGLGVSFNEAAAREHAVSRG